jgi:hypothetical protein
VHQTFTVKVCKFLLLPARHLSREKVSQLHTTQIVSIVDDDEEIRIATARLVRSLGWEARVFASAEEFLQSPHIQGHV